MAGVGGSIDDRFFVDAREPARGTQVLRILGHTFRKGVVMRRTIASLWCLGLAVCSPAFADLFYGASSNGGIYLVDTSTGSTTVLFNAGITWYGATDGVDAASFFATPYGDTLYRIDVVANTATAIGFYGPGISMRELAYDESANTLYGTDYTNLYSIDVNTAAASFIGALAIGGNFWAMDYDPTIDELVAVEQNTRAMYYIDRNTGTTSFVGATGQSRITDIWYSS
ncbi:unnamed protein product, partial [marine sediment metagenome]